MEAILPAHSIEAEQGVIGALMLGASAEEVTKIICKNDFYSGQHKKIFSSIVELSQDKTPIDLVTLSDDLESKDILEDTGGFVYLANIAKNTPSAENYLAYAEIIKKHSLKRKITAAAQSIQEAQTAEEGADIMRKSLDLIQASEKSEASLADIMSGNEGYDHQVSWLIKGFLPEKSLGMVFGPGGSYKSFHALDWAASISTGKEWASCRAKKGAVLYIAGEGQSGIGQRVKAWEIVNGQNTEHLFRTKRAVDMTNRASVDKIASYCRQIEAVYGCHVELIILDTVNRCFGDGDENSTQDMTKFVASCDHLMEEANTGILCVHHSGKDVSKGARGSSVLRNATDYEYSVARTPMLGYTLKCTKAKEFEEPNAQDYALRKVDLGFKNEDNEMQNSLARVGAGRDSQNIEVDEGVQKFIDFMTNNDNSVDNGLNVKFVKEEVKSWFTDAPTEEAKRKSAERLIAKALKHGYIRMAQGFYYLIETTGDNNEWGIEDF